jgi:hypothetical protein
MGSAYREIEGTHAWNGMTIHGLIDTGSNISVLHMHSALGKAMKQSATTGAKRQVTFQQKTCQAEDVTISGYSVNEGVVLPPFVCTMLDLTLAIANFPTGIDLILGTNALRGQIVQFHRSRTPRFIRAPPSNFYQVKLVSGPCKTGQKNLGKLFLVATEHNGSMIADTGNKFSSFCDPDMCNGVVKIVLFKPTSPHKTHNVTIQQNMVRHLTLPKSLSMIENWCPKRITGNLGIDVWAGLFTSTVFDFKNHNMYCSPNN